MNTTDIEARDRRICATYASHRGKPFKSSGKRGHKADALMTTARIWKLPIRDIRAIIETAEAEKRGVDPKTYMAEKAAERNAKTTEWQKQRDDHVAHCKRLGLDADANPIDADANPIVMERFLNFLAR